MTRSFHRKRLARVLNRMKKLMDDVRDIEALAGTEREIAQVMAEELQELSIECMNQRHELLIWLSNRHIHQGPVLATTKPGKVKAGHETYEFSGLPSTNNWRSETN